MHVPSLCLPAMLTSVLSSSLPLPWFPVFTTPRQSVSKVMSPLRSIAPLCVLAVVAFAVPAQEKRVHHRSDLSDHAHKDGEGYQYDHEAFLGKEESKTFDQLTPEESKAKLA